MIRLFLILLIYLTGHASQYDPNVMGRVIENRQAGRAVPTLPAELPRVDGYIAVLA